MGDDARPHDQAASATTLSSGRKTTTTHAPRRAHRRHGRTSADRQRGRPRRPQERPTGPRTTQRRSAPGRMVRLVDAHAERRRARVQPRLELEPQGPADRAEGRRRGGLETSRRRDHRTRQERAMDRPFRQRRRPRARAPAIGGRRRLPHLVSNADVERAARPLHVVRRLGLYADVVDQAGLAEPGGGEHPQGTAAAAAGFNVSASRTST